jgi:Holliday junction resolvase RusA-like endonuclease
MRAQMESLGRAVVIGQPQEGGNKSAMPIYRGSKAKGTREFTGRHVVLEGRTAKKRVQVKAWRELVVEAVQDSPLWLHRGVESPVVVKWYFTVTAPARVPADRLGYPSVRPDTDKLVRATCDAVTDSMFWKDDALKVSEMISKAYVGRFHADGTPALHVPGCVIEIFKITAGPA